MSCSDYVIDATVHLSGLPASVGRTYQLADPHPILPGARQSRSVIGATCLLSTGVAVRRGRAGLLLACCLDVAEYVFI